MLLVTKLLAHPPSPLLREVEERRQTKRQKDRQYPQCADKDGVWGSSHGKCLVHVDGDVDMICFAVHASSSLGS